MMPTTPITTFPWQPDSTATGDLAIKNRREGLMTALKNQRGIHTETSSDSNSSLHRSCPIQRVQSFSMACPVLEGPP